jgi:uncharacterized protein with PIN domain
MFPENFKQPVDPNSRDIDGIALSVGGRCPVCRYQIHVLEGTAAVIKAAVIKTDPQFKRTFAKCPKCKQWLIVPLEYRPEQAAT